MNITPTLTSHGFLQFIVCAETNEDRIILAQFAREQSDESRRFALHGLTITCGCIGCGSFNFGTQERVLSATYLYVGEDIRLKGLTACGHQTSDVFMVQVNYPYHPWSCGWHVTPRKDWHEIKE